MAMQQLQKEKDELRESSQCLLAADIKRIQREEGQAARAQAQAQKNSGAEVQNGKVSATVHSIESHNRFEPLRSRERSRSRDASNSTKKKDGALISPGVSNTHKRKEPDKGTRDPGGGS